MFEAHDPRGCLMCNTAAGAAGTDPDIADWIGTRLDRLSAAFEHALAHDGAAKGDVGAEARQLAQQYVGMRVHQRAAVGQSQTQ